jgi:acid stress-induced BolA-like protein IbaG/YrbA
MILRGLFKGVVMVSLKHVETTIKEKLPDAQVFIRDLTGGGDHLEATVISAEFDGKTRVKQHQIVYAALKQEMATEAIHALALKTYTPEAWQTVSANV